MLLTVELKDGRDTSKAEAAICFDDEGLEFLIKKLLRLRDKKDHMHLMTPSWAGDELTEKKQGSEEYQLINHLQLVKL
jgi:hypothetical protein